MTEWTNWCADAIQHKIKFGIQLIGAPGTAKTASMTVVRRILEERGLGSDLRFLHVPTVEEYDVKGIPIVMKNNEVKYSVADNIKHFYTDVDEGQSRVIVLEELAAGSEPTQKALSAFLGRDDIGLDGVAPKGHRAFIATSNRKNDGAGASDLLAHVRGRVLDIELCMTPAEWLSWALGEGEIHHSVTSYIQNVPENLTIDNPHGEKYSVANPRNWAMLSDTLTWTTRIDQVEGIAISKLGRNVGENFARHFEVVTSGIPTYEDVVKRGKAGKKLKKESDKALCLVAVRSYATRLETDWIDVEQSRETFKHLTIALKGWDSTVRQAFITHVQEGRAASVLNGQ